MYSQSGYQYLHPCSQKLVSIFESFSLPIYTSINRDGKIIPNVKPGSRSLLASFKQREGLSDDTHMYAQTRGAYRHPGAWPAGRPDQYDRQHIRGAESSGKHEQFDPVCQPWSGTQLLLPAAALRLLLRQKA
jgi:hypothetical protein